MKPARLAGRSASAILPVALLLVPKCPLCLLALFAFLGSSLPPAPVLDGIVLAAALGWLAVLGLKTRSLTSYANGVAGIALLLAGRWLHVPAVSWMGAVVMIAVVLRARLGVQVPRAAAREAVHCAAAAGPPP